MDVPASIYEEIDNIAENILIGSKAYDIFPTPIENVLNYSEVVVDHKIDLSIPPDGIISQYQRAIKSALKKIVGIIDLQSNTILLNQSMTENRKRFVKLHEAGHKVLPWQRDILAYVDDEMTLNHDVRISYEREANYFASAILFQKDRFATEIRKLELSIATPLDLSKRYGASFHATLRKYVLSNNQSCALLVLHSDHNNLTSLTVRDSFESPSFRKKIGKLNWPPACNSQYAFVADAYLGKRRNDSGVCSAPLDDGSIIEVSYQLFFNSYNYFIFITPK